MTLQRIDFPVLARGMNREAPPGTLNPQAAEGPLWRELQNLVPHEGELRRREGVVATVGGLPTFLDDENQSVLLLAEILPALGRWLLVTSREVFVGVSGAWVNVTPVYLTGTVSITSGTATVTGLGTAWLARGIVPGQEIELPRSSGDWYKIATVAASGTSIGLTANYTGANLAGANYEVRRVWPAVGIPTSTLNKQFFAATLNGDLYLGGPLSGGTHPSTSINTGDGGVIRIIGAADPQQTITSGFVNTEYVTSGQNEVEAGLDNLGYFIRIRGMTILSDGRLVIATDAYDIGASASYPARIHYSSLLNLAVWTVSPGGFTDITDYSGLVTALTGGANRVHVHLEDGIEIGDLTGAQDPPLRFRPSGATIGAAGPRAVVHVPGGRFAPPGDLFLGLDRRFYVFNGGDATPVDWAPSRHDLQTASAVDLGNSFFRHDSFREFVALFHDGGVSSGTYELRLYYQTGDYAVCYYPLTNITAAATLLGRNLAGSVFVEREDTAGYLGTNRFDRDAAVTAFIYEIRDDEEEDELPLTLGGSATRTVRATTDILPVDLSRRWVVSHVEVNLRKMTFGAEDLLLLVFADSYASISGASNTDSSLLSLTAGSLTSNPQTALFLFSAESGRRLQLSFVGGSTADGSRFDFRLLRMTVWLADVGEARTG